MVGGVRIAVDDHIIVSSDDLVAYKKAWSTLDERYTGTIKMSEVVIMLT